MKETPVIPPELVQQILRDNGINYAKTKRLFWWSKHKVPNSLKNTIRGALGILEGKYLLCRLKEPDLLFVLIVFKSIVDIDVGEAKVRNLFNQLDVICEPKPVVE